MKSVEDLMSDAIMEAQKLGITFEELQEMLTLLYDN